MIDLKTMTDDELNSTRLAVLKEIERRKNLETIPVEIHRLKGEYTAAGGDLEDLSKGA